MIEPPLRSSDCCSRGGVGAWSSHLFAPATAAHEEESARGRATSTLQRLLLTRRSRRVVKPPLRPSDCCSRGGVGAWSSHLYAPATAAHEEESARGRATSTLRPSNCCSRGVGACSSHLYAPATAAHEEESARGRATSTLQRLLLTRRSLRVVEPPLRPSDCCSRGGVGAWSSHLYGPATAAHEESAHDRATSTLQRLLLTRSRRVIEPPLRPSDCCSRGGVGAWSSHLYAQRLLLTRRSLRVVEPPLRPSDCCSRGVGAWSSHLYATATAAHEEESARDRATSTPQRLLLTRKPFVLVVKELLVVFLLPAA